ncbi:MAG: hypothetical protein J1D89_00400 [Agathobacter sp.]|nr:hypothetical protein [Agathobacter sp.]
MVRNILKVLTKNLPFKILAVGLAFILWLIVYNMDDPNITQTYMTNVVIENAATLTEQNKCYQVLDGTNIVSFSVTAKRSILKNLENSNFRASADLNQMITDSKGTTGTVPIEITSNRSNSALTYLNRKTLKLALEDMVSKQYMVNASTTGTVAEGYALGEVTVPNPNVLKVSGPKSIVETIARVVAFIDVEGMSVNLFDNVIPILYDADGNEIDTTRLTLSNNTVTISARILVVREVPVRVSTSGTPAPGYRVSSVAAEPEKIKIKGTASAVNVLSAIHVSGDMVNVDGANGEIITTVEVQDSLPEGISLLDASDGIVSVKVTVEPYRTMRYQIRRDQITVEGLAENYELRFASPWVNVSVSAFEKDFEELNANDITGVVDAGGLEPGSHRLPVAINLPEEKFTCQDVTAEVTISEIGADETEAGTGPGISGGNDGNDEPGENNSEEP